MSVRRCLPLIVALAVAGAGAGCSNGIVLPSVFPGTGGAPTGHNPATASPATASGAGSPEPTVPPLTGTPILFFATSSSATQYNVGGAGVTIKSSGQTIIRYLPQRTYADAVATNYSPDYAASHIYPYVVDDRFFIVHQSDTDTSIGETDPRRRTGGAPWISDTNIAMQIDLACSAVVGNTYYFANTPVWDPFHLRNTDSVFRKEDLGSNPGHDTQLSAGCDGHLQASDGVLFDASYTANSDGTATLVTYQHDLTTGQAIEPTKQGWKITDASQYTEDRFAFSKGIAYWARLAKADHTLEIASNANGSTDWDIVWNGRVSGLDSLSTFAADNGWVAALDWPVGVIFYMDTKSGQNNTIDLHMMVYDMKILYLPS